jgi:hypothetical protein
LGILRELAEQLLTAKVNAPVWLHQNVQGRSETPYELVVSGQLGDVRRAVDTIVAGIVPTTEPILTVAASRDHDVVTEDDDGEGEWVWGDSGDDDSE